MHLIPQPARFVLENDFGHMVRVNPAPRPATLSGGWRPFVWTDDPAAALRFTTIFAAADFRDANMHGGHWIVRELTDKEMAQPAVAT